MGSLEPGWYGDPADPHRERYWDGREWVATRPVAPPAQPRPSGEPRSDGPPAAVFPRPDAAAVMSIESTKPRSGGTELLVAGLVLLALVVGGAVYWFARSAETRQVTLAFDVSDVGWAHPRDPGSSCSGDDVSAGYGDINSITPVKIESADGELIERYELGDGTALSAASALGSLMDLDVASDPNDDPYTCRFSTVLTFTKGSDDGRGFVVSVGRRGEKLVKWDDLADMEVLGLSLS